MEPKHFQGANFVRIGLVVTALAQVPMTAGAIFLRVSAGYNGLMTQLCMICLSRSIGKSSINSTAKSRLSPIRTRAPVPGRSQARATFSDIERQFVPTG
jgi:hypothetical protein